MAMHLEHPHTLGRQAAKRTLDGVIDRLIQNPPAGAQLTGVVKAWEGDRLRFSFHASKHGFGATVDGVLAVTDDLVVLDFDIPSFFKMVIGEARAARALSKGLADVLGQ